MKQNILAVRNDRFGEFLLNIPAFRALKESHISSRLTLVVNSSVQELASAIDCVDEVIVWENKKHTLIEIIRFAIFLKKKKFNICIIFNPSKEFNLISFFAAIPIRVGYKRKLPFLLTHKIEDKKYLGDKHEIDYNLELAAAIGARTGNKSLYLKLDDGIINNLGIPASLDLKNTVIVHPWTSDIVKQWPLERFAQLIQKITDNLNFNVIIVGGKEELAKNHQFFPENGKIINFTGRTNLKQLAVLLKRTKLLISGDSGPVHLASCVDTPVIVLFRNDLPAKSPVRWGPRSTKSIVIAKKHLTDISVDEVFLKIKEVLGAYE